VRYISSADVYPQAVAEARRLTGASGRVAEADLPIVLDDGQAGSLVESWLYETWAARESATFKLPPSTLALEPGDVVAVDIAGRNRLLRLTDVTERGVREIAALSIDPDVYDKIDASPRPSPQPAPVQAGSPAVLLMDLPLWNPLADAQSGSRRGAPHDLSATLFRTGVVLFVHGPIGADALRCRRQSRRQRRHPDAASRRRCDGRWRDRP
jgi:hypothetical protein